MVLSVADTAKDDELYRAMKYYANGHLQSEADKGTHCSLPSVLPLVCTLVALGDLGVSMSLLACPSVD